MGQMLVVRPGGRVVIGPGEIRDVSIDWRPDLPAGTVITATTFDPPDGLTVVSSGNSDDGTVARLTDAVLNARYTVKNWVTLSNGEIHNGDFDVICRERRINE